MNNRPTNGEALSKLKTILKILVSQSSKLPLSRVHCLESKKLGLSFSEFRATNRPKWVLMISNNGQWAPSM